MFKFRFKPELTTRPAPTPVPVPPVPAYPDVGVRVDAQLAAGEFVRAYWNGVQWWTSEPGRPEVPVVNEFITAWVALSGSTT